MLGLIWGEKKINQGDFSAPPSPWCSLLSAPHCGPVPQVPGQTPLRAPTTPVPFLSSNHVCLISKVSWVSILLTGWAESSFSVTGWHCLIIKANLHRRKKQTAMPEKVAELVEGMRFSQLEGHTPLSSCSLLPPASSQVPCWGDSPPTGYKTDLACDLHLQISFQRKEEFEMFGLLPGPLQEQSMCQGKSTFWAWCLPLPGACLELSQYWPPLLVLLWEVARWL